MRFIHVLQCLFFSLLLVIKFKSYNILSYFWCEWLRISLQWHIILSACFTGYELKCENRRRSLFQSSVPFYARHFQLLVLLSLLVLVLLVIGFVLILVFFLLLVHVTRRWLSCPSTTFFFYLQLFITDTYIPPCHQALFPLVFSCRRLLSSFPLLRHISVPPIS